MSAEYYSQNGEDFLLSQFFKDASGFFVEIGCIDGRRFSNTYFFELRGWKGICVEAHRDYIQLLKANRPNSKVIHCAVGEADEPQAVFYANARGSLSSLDPTTEERWRRDYAQYFSGFQQQIVSKRTLTTIFTEAGVSGIDILSLDIEGYEVQALSGLDFKKFSPSVLVVESDSDEHREKIAAMVTPHGYRLALDLGGNLFYSRLPDFEKTVSGKYFSQVPLTYTQHPLDKNGDVRKMISIDTRLKAPPSRT
jgi:FkbM family methyltransferase